MDAGVRSPLIDFFRRGEVASDIRMLAARGAMAPRAHEQLALLLLLADDADPQIASAAAATIDQLPRSSVSRFLARKDVPQPMVEFFASRGIEPDTTALEESDEPLVDVAAGVEPMAGDVVQDETAAPSPVLSGLAIIDRMKLAMRGTREQRSQLIRDSNKLVAVAVLSSPKLTESEVENFARMANLTEDVLRIIGTNRAWVKNYNVVSALTRNPKMPPAMAMNFLQRLNERDLKRLATDRNVAEPVRLAARKFVSKAVR
ncbi:MAG: hypothetical protein M3541_07505 [Acidobacteriota bacterium]|nr:hypothetical protein [Acidobacteriota bacterium]